MNNFREGQTRDNIANKSKLTLVDLKDYINKSNKTFIKNTAEDDY